MSSVAKSSAANMQNRLKLCAQASDGKIQTLELAGISEGEATSRLLAQGLRVLSIESTALKASSGNSLARFNLLLFSQELLALLEAGLNLSEALQTLNSKEKKPAAQLVLGNVVTALSEGRNFSDVLASMPQHFPEVYIATVRASEKTGDLPRALHRYIAYQYQFETIRKKLIATAVYPAVLLVVGLLVTLFLLGYVVPRFSAVYESSGRDVPWLSMQLLSFGSLVNRHWIIAALALLTLLVGCAWGLQNPKWRTCLLETALRLPGLARKADEFRLARFYRAVGLLLESGIPLTKAMGMVMGLLGPVHRPQLAQARLAVEQGQSLSVALMAAGLASPIAESLIRVGERSGQMAEMLERTARFHDEEFARWIDVSSRLIEPALMAVIGVVIGGVVVLMYMPIFELAGSL